MRVFATKGFVRRKDRPPNATLRAAIAEADAGLVDAHLDGPLIKKRIAGKGRGKRGGYRTIIALRHGERAFFLYGFAKNARDTITAAELTALKRLAEELVGYTEHELDAAVTSGALVEVTGDDKDG